MLLLGLAIHLLLPQLASLDHSLKVVEGMRLWAVGLALLAQVGSYFGSGYLLRGLAAVGGGRLSVGRGALITIASSTIGTLIGGVFGTAAATYRWAQDAGAGAKGAGLAAWMPTVLNNSLLLALGVFGAASLLASGSLSAQQFVVVVIAYRLISFWLPTLLGLPLVTYLNRP